MCPENESAMLSQRVNPVALVGTIMLAVELSFVAACSNMESVARRYRGVDLNPSNTYQSFEAQLGKGEKASCASGATSVDCAVVGWPNSFQPLITATFPADFSVVSWNVSEWALLA